MGGGSDADSDLTACLPQHGAALQESVYSNRTRRGSVSGVEFSPPSGRFAVQHPGASDVSRPDPIAHRRTAPAPRSGAIPASPIMYTRCPANG